MSLASYIDHTILQPNVTKKAVLESCEEAKKFGFASVCVPPCYVKVACCELATSKIPVSTVIGFPLGYQHSSIKKEEARKALSEGALELDMMINLCDVKNKKYTNIEQEISLIRSLGFFTLKVIIETAYLDKEEKLIIAKCCEQSGADFVKTSTGFASAGATVEDVTLLRHALSPSVLVKASGGIRTREQALAMIHAGASRLGTSHGVSILISEDLDK